MNKTEAIFARIALQEPAIAGLLEDLGYGPWRAASAQAKKIKRKSRKRNTSK